MPSPFPGMDPWLERPGVFPDLHDSLIYLLRTELNARMPAGYAAIGRTLVYTDPAQQRQPDVSLLGRGNPRPAAGGAAVATLPGLRAAGTGRRPAADPAEHRYLEVVAHAGQRLVTAIEVLSPANKRPGDAGQAVFRAKQAEMRQAGVNLVEIDLLRAGGHATAVPRPRLEAFGPFDYHVAVTVAGDPDEFHAAAWPLSERLPAFGVPLDPGVTPVTVDLQMLLDRAYDTGRYADLTDYAGPCDPPLSADQAAWAAGVLARREAPRDG